jgi:altronate dehydratase
MPETTPTAPVKSWKTTLLGVLTILAAIAGAGISYLKTGSFDFTAVGAAVAAGTGLIVAKDHA